MGPVKYTVQQRVFIYATFIKTDSPKETRRIFKEEFSGVSPPSNANIKQIVQIFRETGSFSDYMSLHQRRVLTEEKLDELCARVHSSKNTTLSDLAQETGLSNTSVRIAAKLLKMHYKVKIKKKKPQSRKRKYPVRSKRKEAVPVSVFSVKGHNTVDSTSTNDDSFDGEFVLPDDPLADEESNDDLTLEENSESMPFSGFKTEMKEELIIEDDYMEEDDNQEDVIVIDDDDDEKEEDNIKEEIINEDEIKEEVIIEDDDDTFESNFKDCSSNDTMEDPVYENGIKT